VISDWHMQDDRKSGKVIKVRKTLRPMDEAASDAWLKKLGEWIEANPPPASGVALKMAEERTTNKIVWWALNTYGNVQLAADKLGMLRSTLFERMRAQGIKWERKR